MSLGNVDISGWNTSSVQDFSGMFYHDSVFNQDLSGWDASAAVKYDSMLYGAFAFQMENRPRALDDVAALTRDPTS